MDITTLYKVYLQEGTIGYAVIRKFHSRYADILARTNLTDINDVLHEVFLSLSKTDFENVRNVEHYIMRAIKLQCWSLLDKAIRQKAMITKSDEMEDDEKKRNYQQASEVIHHNQQLAELEGIDLLVQINIFKVQLNPHEIRLLNLLIDETERSEIATHLEINLNTLDTNIRRLRIKLAEYLKNLGYVYQGLERFI